MSIIITAQDTDKIKHDDLHVLAGTLYAEARGEPTEAIMGVASVIHVRSAGDRSKYAATCLKPSQFSVWNRGVVVVNESTTEWAKCINIAKMMLEGMFKPTINADHFDGTRFATPAWSVGMKKVQQIGKVQFWRSGNVYK